MYKMVINTVAVNDLIGSICEHCSIFKICKLWDRPIRGPSPLEHDAAESGSTITLTA